MSKEIEVAKKLLKQALALNDQELIDLANEILEKVNTTAEPIAKKKAGRPSKKKQEINPPSPPKKIVAEKIQIGSKSTVQWQGNTWVDTGELGELGAEAKTTPKIKPAQRRGPVQKINVTCSMCNKNVKILPVHKTEFFKCDDCLRKLTGVSK